MAFEPEPEFLTVEQAAAYLEVTPGTIRRLLRQHGLGEFLRSSLGKQVFIRREDLDAVDLGQGQVRTAANRTARGGRSGAA